MTVLRTLLATVCLLLSAGPGWAKEDNDKGKPPPTQRTQTLRADTFKKMEAVQQAIDEKKYEAAIDGLDEIRKDEDRLNDYERATLYNLYAAVHLAEDRPKDAIAAYRKVLEQEKLPEGLRNSTLFALAQSYFVLEDYARALRLLDAWFDRAEDPSPDAYVMLAQAHYQQSDHAAAEKALLDALRTARRKGLPPKESWLGLLRAVYYEMERYARAAKVLKVLVARWPKESYYLQLAGMYGLMGDQDRQTAVMHAAAVGGMLSRQADLINLARLYLLNEAPYPAVEVLQRGFADGVIEETADHLQLYAQALSFAKEYDAQIPVLEKLATKTDDAQHYTFLGQGLAELGRWPEAAKAFRKALQAKNLRDANSVRLQLGTALFNAGELKAAEQVFVQVRARGEERDATTAENWLKFVRAEMQRKQAMAGH